VVFASSCAIYGNDPALPKTERMAPRPESPYALGKLVGEQYCRLYSDLYGLQTICLRYFNVFGPGQDPSSEYSAVIPKFICLLAQGKQITVFGDGEQTRDFVFVENIVEANLRALHTDVRHGIYNIGTGASCSVNTLIETLAGIGPHQARVHYADA